jgi:hypothetical protein
MSTWVQWCEDGFGFNLSLLMFQNVRHFTDNHISLTLQSYRKIHYNSQYQNKCTIKTYLRVDSLKLV